MNLHRFSRVNWCFYVSSDQSDLLHPCGFILTASVFISILALRLSRDTTACPSVQSAVHHARLASVRWSCQAGAEVILPADREAHKDEVTSPRWLQPSSCSTGPTRKPARRFTDQVHRCEREDVFPQPVLVVLSFSLELSSAVRSTRWAR